MDWYDDVLRDVSGLKSAERESARFGNSVRTRFGRVLLAIPLLLILFFPMICAGQDPLDPPVKPSATEKWPFYTDMTIWTAHTVGSVNLMSTYKGQEMFAMGVGLRQHLFTLRHTELSLNFEIVPVCQSSFPGKNGRTYHYGAGGSLGTAFTPRKRLPVQPYFEAGVGFLMFTQPTPVETTRRFNFTLQFGGGFRSR